MASVTVAKPAKLRAFFEKYHVFVNDVAGDWSNVFALLPKECMPKGDGNRPVHTGTAVLCQCVSPSLVSREDGAPGCRIRLKVCNTLAAWISRGSEEGCWTLTAGTERLTFRTFAHTIDQAIAALFEQFDLDSVFALEAEPAEDCNDAESKAV